MINDLLKEIRAVYPKRHGGQGWGNVKRLLPALLADYSPEELIEGAKNYGDYCRATGEQYVRMAQTFYGPGEWFLEEYDLPTNGEITLTLDQEAKVHDIVRADGESDESLTKRVGIAQTKRLYG